MLRRWTAYIAIVLTAVATVSLIAEGTASAGLSERSCDNFVVGDRRLSICAQLWLTVPPTQDRGVLVMHTYRAAGNQWVDDRSQSITLNQAEVTTNSSGIINYTDYGQDTNNGPTTCRVNSPTSSNITCSVPNTSRVVFYGKAVNHVAQTLQNCIYKVSWRDSGGNAHTIVSGIPSSPDMLPLCVSA